MHAIFMTVRREVGKFHSRLDFKMNSFSMSKFAYILYFAYNGILLMILTNYSPISIFIEYICFRAGYFVSFLVTTFVLFKLIDIVFLSKVTIPIKDKAVFITGCDTGFGHLLAKHLDSKGMRVFAACFNPSGSGAQQLEEECSTRLKIIGLDVTKDESVTNAFHFVKSNLNDAELFAVVNNAGIITGIATDITSMQMFEECLDVNCYGVIRVTKTFLPLLMKSKGRIINITSSAGKIGIPRLVSYCTSKFGADGFTTSLRNELKAFGIKVVSIEPSSFNTGIFTLERARKMIDEQVKLAGPEIINEYGEEYFEEFKKYEEIFVNASSSNLGLVVKDLESAICLKYPNDRYMPCENKITKLFLIAYLIMPVEIRDFLMNLINMSFPKPKSAQK